jgi:serine/threonine protein phosphatase PrpC
MQLATAQASAAGKKPVNEDSMGLYVPEGAALTHKGAALVIADGVSAAEAGREAAEICVQTFLDDYFGTPDAWSVETSAERVLTAINRWLYGRSSALEDTRRGYVSTLSALILKSHTGTCSTSVTRASTGCARVACSSSRATTPRRSTSTTPT